MPLSAPGSATWDKGKAAVIVQQGEAVDESDERLFTTRSSIFVRGEGAGAATAAPRRRWSCPTGSRTPTPPTRQRRSRLLYRLCGDRNPLHADPEFAAAAGFPAPILHGLCSYGIVLRTVVDALLESDAAAVRRFTARFAGVVFPGEAIQVRAWDEGPEILESATIAAPGAERHGAPVLADAVLTRA